MAAMNRRAFLHAAAGATFAIGKGAQRKRPNVLFIGVDDLRPQLGCYGQTHIQSPNIDRLASEGLRFDRAYCQQAVCAPTRASLLTGARPDSTKVHDLQTPINTGRPDLVSLPHQFRKNGYETISLGKIYHHSNEDPNAWSAPPWQPKGNWAGGWRAYADPLSRLTVSQSDAALKAAHDRALKSDARAAAPLYGRGPAYEAPDVPDNAYPDGLTCDRAISELQRMKDRPFFLATGFLKPHLPFNAPKRYWDLYRPDDIQLPARSDWPENMPKPAGSNWGELRAYTGIPKDGPVDEATLRMLIHGYYACVSYTDAQVGRLLAELGRLGLRDNTIVILWGDHGWKLGDYGAWCKHTNLELDTHVPMLLSVPGRKPGRATKALVEYVDIYPTLAEAAGVPVPDHCEGTSMLPLLEDPARPWKSAAFSQYPRGQGLMGYSVRTERWRYTEWIARPSGDVAARELYDHAATDAPSANLAALTEHAATVQAHSKLLDGGQGWRNVRATCQCRT
jgi:iduronate 2-sulfatase